MKEKRFRGFINGHYASGVITEKDEVDFQREREEREKGGGVTVGKAIGAVVVGALIIGVLASIGGKANNTQKKIILTLAPNNTKAQTSVWGFIFIVTFRNDRF
ncbi:MAG: hypothetical protein PHX25_03075 [Candidatus Pacebacteria bacterium]|nr:hypothetical protein [Candidatus Paceibacterota bacterium]